MTIEFQSSPLWGSSRGTPRWSIVGWLAAREWLEDTWTEERFLDAENAEEAAAEAEE